MRQIKWRADLYSKGSYIQSHLSDFILPQINNIKSGDHILDVGCGEGEYTCKLASIFSNCTFDAIDTSQDMIDYAKENNQHPHVSYFQADVQSELHMGPFDNIVSFWCLHWTDIELATKQLYRVLKEGGEIFALFHSHSAGTLSNAIASLASAEDSLYLQAFAKKAIEITHTKKVFMEKQLQQLPFPDYSFSQQQIQITLPSLDTLNEFFMALPFMRDVDEQRSELILEHIMEYFQQECDSRFGGKYIYYAQPYFLTIRKPFSIK